MATNKASAADLTAQLPQDTFGRLLSPYLICVERVAVSYVDKGWHTALRAPKWGMTPCRGVGCVREDCVRSHCVDMRKPGPALRELPTLENYSDDDYSYPSDPDEYDSDEHILVFEEGLADALRDWARVHVRPLLDRPLTMLKLPSIARPAVILSYLAELHAQITVVYFSTYAVRKPYFSSSGLFRLSRGVSRPNQAVNLPPQQGIAAIIAGDNLDDKAWKWKPILKHAPRLQYLSMAYGPTSRRSDLAKALKLVPNVRFLDLGRTGGGIFYLDGSGNYLSDCNRIKRLLRHAGNVEVLRCIEGSAFRVHVVRALKRSCCPRLREAHVDEDQLRLVDDRLFPWDNEKMPILLPGCDGVIYKDPKDYGKESTPQPPVPTGGDDSDNDPDSDN